MRFSTSAIVAFASTFAFVAAQDLSSIPSCALPCFAAAIQASGCSLSDAKCQCTTGSQKITDSLTSCAPSKCSSADLAKIAPAAAGICSAAGYALPSSALAAASGTSMAASAMTSMKSGSPTMSTHAASGSASRAASSSALPQQTTGAAAGNFVNGALVIAMGVLAL